MKDGAKLIGIPYKSNGDAGLNAVQINPVLKGREKYIEVIEKNFKCSSYYFASNPSKNDSISIDALSALGINPNESNFASNRSALQVIPDCTLTLSNPEAQTSTALLMTLAEKRAFGSPAVVQDTSGTVIMLAAIADYVCEGHFERENPEAFRNIYAQYQKPSGFTPYAPLTQTYVMTNGQTFTMPIQHQHHNQQVQQQILQQQQYLEAQMVQQMAQAQMAQAQQAQQAQIAHSQNWRQYPDEASHKHALKAQAAQAAQAVQAGQIADPIMLNMAQSSSLPQQTVAMQLARMQQMQDQAYHNARQTAMAAMSQIHQPNHPFSRNDDMSMRNHPFVGLLPAKEFEKNFTEHKNPVVIDADQRILLSEVAKKLKSKKRKIDLINLLNKKSDTEIEAETQNKKPVSDSDSEEDEINQKRKSSKK
jgi:hypothetical protein